MSLSGSFYTYPIQDKEFGLYCDWTGKQSQGGNYTDITLNVYLRFYTIEVGSRSNSTISINGETETYTSPAINDYKTKEWHNVLLKSKTVRVKHNADGTKTSVNLSASWRFDGYYSGVKIGTITASTTVDLDSITVYNLEVSSGEGSNIVVHRTSSLYANAGVISHGAILYCGDKLKITFTPNENYAIATHTVNCSEFTSGNTHTVAGNVSVISTAQVLASSVGATDANIGSVSAITITKYHSGYYHSLKYSFGSLSGYITSSGDIQNSEVRFDATSIAFVVPEIFYEQIPTAKSGKCTITCYTYETAESDSILGSATSCIFTATASVDECSPIVAAYVSDVNSVTNALTGDENVLIRYRSTAKAGMTATGRHSATISKLSISGYDVTGPTIGNMVTGFKRFQEVEDTSFTFSATDSRGYTTTTTVCPTVIAYVSLTCNPIITRPTPTGRTIALSVSGNVYRGSFGDTSAGAYANTLTLEYRYKPTGGSYGQWNAIDESCIVLGISNYKTLSSVILPDEFDYRQSYEFQVRATDGAGGYELSSVQTTVPVQRGIPVFDWGENDFNINVALTLSNVNILDIIYPIGSVYMHSGDTMPEVIQSIGTWTSVQPGIDGVYAWKRIT